MRKAKRKYIGNIAKEAEVAAERGNGKTLFQLSKILTGKFTPAGGAVKSKQGKINRGKKSDKCFLEMLMGPKS